MNKAENANAINTTKILIINGMEKIFPDRVPTHILAQASMLKNEKYSFQVAVYTLAELEKYTLTVEGAEGVQVRKVNYAPCKRAGYDKDADDKYVIFPEHAEGYYPDYLTSMDGNFVSEGGSWVAFWVTLENMPVGVHTLRFSLYNQSTNTDEGSAQVEIKVIDRELPPLDIRYTTWFHYDCLSDIYKVKVFSKKFNEIMNAYFANMVAHGMNTIYTPLFTPALDTKVGTYRKTVQLVDIRKEGKKYAFDFTRLLAFMQNAQAAGFTSFEFSHLATQWGAEFCPKVVATVGGRKRRIFGWDKLSLSPEYIEFLSQLLPALVEVLDENGYQGKCYFHISDEPREEHLERYGKLSAVIRRLLKHYPIMDALSDFGFYKEGFVDVPVVATECTAPFQEGKVESWVYYCCTQTFQGLSNRLFNMPLQRARILGAQLYQNDAKGFWHWGYNFYYSELSVRKLNPFYETDADERLPSGDCYIVYPGENGQPLDSIRGEALFDAFQDYRALSLLATLRGKDFVAEFLKSEGIAGYFDYPQTLAWHVQFREKINTLIAEGGRV